MRLTDDQQSAIVDSARRHFGADCRVALFGSRADDSRRGGDIDLYVQVPRPLEEAWPQRASFLVDLKNRIGDQQIDVVLRASDSTPKTIYRVAEKDGIVLT